MKSPKDMRIIQIDVTNACVHHCSNCTRFCGLHKKPFFMDFETFQRAVDSLDGYVGTIGLMGGEPTLHPEFEKMARYLAKKRPPLRTNAMLRPQARFMDAIHDLEGEHTFPHPCLGGMRQTVNGPGLWSSIGETYKKYYEVIQDTIQYQALNDHVNPMYHQPALITRKALEIPDKEWLSLRDNCWIQNIWSASITPKGAFFCEVAAALDMLFDGPGGWPIEQGWWKKEPEEFGSQLQWCELCGLALDTFMRNANDEIYDVSKDMYEKLAKIKSPLLSSNPERMNILDIQNGKIPDKYKAASRRFSESMPYTESYHARFCKEKTNLTDKKFAAIVVCEEESAVHAAASSLQHFSEAYIYAEKHICQEIMRLSSVEGTDVKCYDAKEKTLGYVIYEALKAADYNKYTFLLKGDIKLIDAVERLEKLILNPGTLLYAAYEKEWEDAYFCAKPGSEAALLSGAAHSIRTAGWDVVLSIQKIEELVRLWQPQKVFRFAPKSEREAPIGEIIKGERYAVYGAGIMIDYVVQKVKENGAEVVAIIDSSEKKIGTNICGFTVQAPAYLQEHREEIDKVLIAPFLYYGEIKARAMQYGYEERNLAWI